jgi:hypothetical protein
MPEELIRGFSKRTGQIDAELDRLVADGRERTPRLVKWTISGTYGALLSSDDFGSSVERAAKRHPLCRRCPRGRLVWSPKVEAAVAAEGS